MVIGHLDDLKGKQINGENIKGVVKKVPIGPDDGWDGYVMRVFAIEPGGHTPRHTHKWPHINYIISGKGTLHLDGRDHTIEAGSYAYVPEGKLHQFMNPGEETLSFICIVPEHGDV